MGNTTEDLPGNRHPLEIKWPFQLPTWYKSFVIGLLGCGYLQMNLIIRKGKIITRKYLSSASCIHFPIDFKICLNTYKSKRVSGISAFIIQSTSVHLMNCKLVLHIFVMIRLGLWVTHNRGIVEYTINDEEKPRRLVSLSCLRQEWYVVNVLKALLSSRGVVNISIVFVQLRYSQ